MNTDLEYVIINLDHRKDRYDSIMKRLPKSFYPIERFSAIYGHKLYPTRALEQLFNSNDYGYRRGIIGCALSHIKVWIEHIDTDKPIFVLEDDAYFVSDCKDKINRVFSLIKNDWDIIFLGYLPWEDTKLANTIDDVQPEKWNFLESRTRSKGGTHGYIIHPKCIPSLLSFIQMSGMTNAIDTMMLRACDFLNIYHCKYPIIYQPHMVNSNEKLDTDIQNDFLSLKRSFIHRMNEELTYYTQHSIPFLIVYDSIDSSVLDKNIIICYDGKCHHSNLYQYITYYIEHVPIHIPLTLINTFPFLSNIGLIVDGKWSLSNILV